MNRREYPVRLTINNRSIVKVIIDPHYEKKHLDTVNDEIIISLVRQLDGRIIEPEKTDGDFSYFANDNLILNNKRYKLVWLLEEDTVYIGVINCYRR